MASFSAMSPPPMRGYVIHWCGPITRHLHILGVVVKTITWRHNDTSWDEALVLPVVFDTDFLSHAGGGLCVVDPTDGDWKESDHSVLWCWWPESEDDQHIEAAREAFLARKEART